MNIDLGDLHWFTFVPVWVIQDGIVLVLAVLLIAFVINNEPKPGAVLLEFFCVVFLYAAVYENLATVVGWYGFGRSLLMVFNVPLTVPIIEYLVLYMALRLGTAMLIPAWTIPVLVGGFGMLTDFVLDPLALSQVAHTAEGTIGRWTWFIGPADVNYFGAPIYNFTGWMLILGYGSAFILLGRWWFRRSGEKAWVGVVYPILATLLALGVLVSPLSALILWLGPWLQKGSWSEYVGLAVSLAAFLAVLVTWRARMRRSLSWKTDWIILLVVGVLQGSNLVFLLIGAQWAILWPSLGFITAELGIIASAFLSSRRMAPTTDPASQAQSFQSRPAGRPPSRSR